MRVFKELSGKEKGTALAVLLLYPFMLLFARLGKSVKFLNTRGRQITASALTACLLLTMLPLSGITASAATGTDPQVSYKIGEAYKYTSTSGISTLAHGKNSPLTSTAISSANGNVISLGTTANTSSLSTNGKLIYLPVAVTVTVPANTAEYYLQHDVAVSATRVVQSTSAAATANAAVYYLGTQDTSSEITFYPYSGGGDTKAGTDAKELNMACLGKVDTTSKVFTMDVSKVIVYSNTSDTAVKITHYFGVMIAAQNASKYTNTMTGTFTFTAKALHGHDGAIFDTAWKTTGGAVSESGNYYLSSDMIATGNIAINSGVTANLCLNGYTLNMGEFYLTNNGTLLICDCGDGGGITSTIPSSSASPKGTVSNKSTLTVTGGHISNTGDVSGQSHFAIVNNGKAAVATVTGGKVTSTSYGIYNYGSYSATAGPSLTLGGSLVVESTHIAVRNAYGTVDIGGGTYTSTDSYGISNSGTESLTAVMTVTGGNITGTTGISNDSHTDLTVSGETTIIGTSSYGVTNSSNFTFIDGSIVCTGNGSGIYNNCTGKAVLTMKGGRVVSENSHGIYNNGGRVDMSGGTVTSPSNNGIYNTTYTNGSTTYIGTLTVTGGEITGVRGIYNADEQAVVHMKGGKVAGTSSNGLYNRGLLYLSGSPVIIGATADIYKTDTAAIHAQSNDTNPVAYVGTSGDPLTVVLGSYTVGNTVVCHVTAANRNSFKVAHSSYTLIQSGDNLILAVPHTHDNDTFTEWTATGDRVSESGNYYLSSDMIATGDIAINSGVTATLCLNGHTLNMGEYYISNAGTLTVCDCGTDGKITSIDNGIGNTGTVTVTGGTVSGIYGIRNSGNGTVEISGGTVIGTTDGIYNYNGIIKVSGGSVYTAERNGIWNYKGRVEISGGAVTGSTMGIYIENAGSVTVSGGAVIAQNGRGIYNLNGGTIVVSNGEVTGSEYGIYNEVGTLTVTAPARVVGGKTGIFDYTTTTTVVSGTVVSTGEFGSGYSYGIYFCGTGVLEFSGTVNTTGKYSWGIYNVTTGTVNAAGTVTAYGSTACRGIYNDANGTVNSSGTVTATGGSSRGISNNQTGTITVTGGSVSSTYYGIRNYGPGTIYISGGTVTGTDCAIQNNDTGVIFVSGGTVSSEKYGIHGKKGSVYLSGTPTVSGDIASLYKNSNHLIYAQSNDSTPVPYSGDPLTVYVDNGSAGDIVVNKVNDQNSTAFSVTNEGYSLKQEGENLILAIVHTHSFAYTVSGDGKTVTAACAGEGTCDYTGTDLALTIVAPEMTVFGDGKSPSATLSGTGLAGVTTLPAIHYVGRNGTDYADTTTPPTGVGQYTASLTVEGQTIRVDYAIESVPPTYTVTIPAEITLGETVTVQAEGVSVGEGWEVHIKLTATSGKNNAFTLANDQNQTLTYRVSRDGTPVAIGDTVLALTPASGEVAGTELAFSLPLQAPYSGDYSGTVTFTVSTERGAT